MQIAIIGTGQVGQALAGALQKRGHDVVLGSRDPAAAQGVADRLGVGVTTQPRAAQGADVVILALPWNVAETAVRALGDLAGKTVIDCMNPLGMQDGVFGLVLGHTTSGGEILAGWLPGAHVVKTLNQVGAEVMADASGLPHRPAMFLAGDDPAAKAMAAGLVADLGFDPLDAGDLTRSRLLEPLAMVWINQALFRGMGRTWALAAVHPARAG